MAEPIITKFCNSCQKTKDNSNFYKNRSKPDGLSSMCKPCNLTSNQKRSKSTEGSKKHREYMRQWRKDNPRPEKQLIYYRKYTYGITDNEYNQMVKAQDGLCAICKKLPAKMLFVDHCHETGKVRGLLCNKCNVALGYLGDNIQGIKNALAYLEKSCWL